MPSPSSPRSFMVALMPATLPPSYKTSSTLALSMYVPP